MTQLELQAFWLERTPVLLPAQSPLTVAPPQPQPRVSQNEDSPPQPQGGLTHWAWNAASELAL